PFPCDRRITKPDPKIHGAGLDDDLNGNLTRYQYKANLRLTENTLKLAGHSSAPIQTHGSLASIIMDARIIKRIRAKKAKRMVTPPSDSPHPPLVPIDSTPRSHGARFPCPNYIAPIEVASEDSDPVAEDNLLAEESPEPNPELLIRKKSKDKEIAAASKRKHKSNHLGRKENLRVASELTAWWKEAQVELLSPTYKPAEMRELRVKTHVGQDSWELYKSTILPCDHALLTPMSHIRVEQNFAHSLSQAYASGHHLSMKCTYWQHEKMVADQLLEEEKYKLTTCKEEKVELKVQKAELEARLRELRSKIATTTESAKAEGFSAGQVVGREEYLALEDYQHQLEIACDQGRYQYLASDDHRKLWGARDCRMLKIFSSPLHF
ncbi:UNVERIFIED_CONTAM: hypothetical protein Sindi_1307600, partial [Sesamum indicum]